MAKNHNQLRIQYPYPFESRNDETAVDLADRALALRGVLKILDSVPGYVPRRNQELRSANNRARELFSTGTGNSEAMNTALVNAGFDPHEAVYPHALTANFADFKEMHAADVASNHERQHVADGLYDPSAQHQLPIHDERNAA